MHSFSYLSTYQTNSIVDYLYNCLFINFPDKFSILSNPFILGQTYPHHSILILSNSLEELFLKLFA